MNRGSSGAMGFAFGGLIALAAAMGIGRFVYTPILPFMADGLGLTKAESGLIASANYLGYFLGALAAAATRLPGGRRGWFLAAVAVSGLTTGLMGAVSSMAPSLLLRFAGGVASAFVMVLASGLVLDRLAAEKRPGLSALHFAGVGGGITVSALLVSLLAAAGYGWRMHWLAGGALSIAALGAVVRLVPSEGPPPPIIQREKRGNGIDRRLTTLIAAYGLFGFGYVITATFISTMVRTAPAIQSIEPVIWLVVGLAAIPSVALWTWVGRRLGNGVSFAIACVLEGLGVAMSVLAATAPAIILSAALLGGTFVGLTAVGLIHARALSPGNPHRSVAFMTAAFGLGQMIGPAFAGYGFDLTGSFLLPSLTAAGALFVSALMVFEMPKRPRAPS